jgi:hypothetical protein
LQHHIPGDKNLIAALLRAMSDDSDSESTGQGRASDAIKNDTHSYELVAGVHLQSGFWPCHLEAARGILLELPRSVSSKRDVGHGDPFLLITLNRSLVERSVLEAARGISCLIHEIIFYSLGL